MSNRMIGNVGFEEDIRPLFTDGDIVCMGNHFDLSDWRSVKENSDRILSRLRRDNPLLSAMPPPDGWPEEKKVLFASWIEDGAPKRRGDNYAAFFRDLDSYTEYHDVYGRPTEENYMQYVGRYFGRDRNLALNLWKEYAELSLEDAEYKDELWEEILKEINSPIIKNSILKVEELMVKLLEEHFNFDSQLDTEAILDAFTFFGKDELPEDLERYQRIVALNDPEDFRLPYARYHRMDGAVMWFNWMGHIECAHSIDSGSNAHVRQAFMSGVCLGSSMDFVFRQREKTKTKYYDVERGEKRMQRQAERNLNDFTKGIKESHELYQVFRGELAGGPRANVAESGRFLNVPDNA